MTIDGKAAAVLAVTAFMAGVMAVSVVNADIGMQGRRYINGIYAPRDDQKNLDRLYDTARRDSKYVDSIKKAREGWSGLDAAEAVESMTDDAKLIDITDDGIKIKVDGKEQMRANMNKSFAGKASSPAGKWVPEKSGGETWGIYKNISVTYHYSTFVKDDGTEWTRPMIVIAEHKDGKRWREWRFMPVDR